MPRVLLPRLPAQSSRRGVKANVQSSGWGGGRRNRAPERTAYSATKLPSQRRRQIRLRSDERKRRSVASASETPSHERLDAHIGGDLAEQLDVQCRREPSHVRLRARRQCRAVQRESAGNWALGRKLGRGVSRLRRPGRPAGATAAIRVPFTSRIAQVPSASCSVQPPFVFAAWSIKVS